MSDPGGMRSYWDDAAKKNAAWYVDTSLSYNDPDMDKFWETGVVIADELFTDAPVKPEGRGLAVEIGPGLGRICKALRRDFDRVVGVDISPEMVRQANEMAQEHNGGDGLEFVLGDGTGIAAIESGTADLVVSFTVFQHIPKPAMIESYIADAGRALKPGGVLAFQWNNTPHARWWAVRREALALLQRLGIKRGSHDRHAAQFLGSRVPLSRIDAAIRGAGMRLEATKGLDTLYAWAWARKS